MNMVLVNQEQVLALRKALPAVTKAWLQEVLGVSETTWRSLRDGRPIRQSTYARLVAKFERTPHGSVVGWFDGASSGNDAGSTDTRPSGAACAQLADRNRRPKQMEEYIPISMAES
jgi:hypothetical protein